MRERKEQLETIRANFEHKACRLNKNKITGNMAALFMYWMSLLALHISRGFNAEEANRKAHACGGGDKKRRDCVTKSALVTTRVTSIKRL